MYKVGKGGSMTPTQPTVNFSFPVDNNQSIQEILEVLSIDNQMIGSGSILSREALSIDEARYKIEQLVKEELVLVLQNGESYLRNRIAELTSSERTKE